MLAVEPRVKTAPGPVTSVVDMLVADAQAALGRERLSVVDKTTLPPSGDRRDYWHPAPYWHPNPETPDGLPYVRRDGVRVAGTNMYEEGSEKYDRTRLQHLFDDTTILMLASRFTEERAFAERAAENLRVWFLDPETRMNPNLDYAQVRRGHNGDKGAPTGIIEMKDLYYFLDAVRLMREAGVLPPADEARFRDWLGAYLRWLISSRQGESERRAGNNHGLYYDLQVGAIAGYLGERLLLLQTLRSARARIEQHFAPDGSQPEELSRTTTAHYCCFNFQGWMNVAELAARWGADLWNYETPDARGLKKGASWLLSHAGKPWPYEQIDEFDEERFTPVWHALPAEWSFPRPSAIPPSRYSVKPRFYPHDGIRPYWNLG